MLICFDCSDLFSQHSQKFVCEYNQVVLEAVIPGL